MKPWPKLLIELDSAIEFTKAAARLKQENALKEAALALHRAVEAVHLHEPSDELEAQERLFASGALMSLCHEYDIYWLEPVALSIAKKFATNVNDNWVEGPLPDDRVELLAIGAPYADWPPARRFWNSYIIADPLGIGPFHGLTSTKVSLDRHAEDFRRLMSSRPEGRNQLIEKLKATACRAVCRAAQYGRNDQTADNMGLLRDRLRELAGRPASDFAALLNVWPTLLSEDELSPPPAETDAKLWLAMRLAPISWLWLLDQERRRVGS